MARKKANAAVPNDEKDVPSKSRKNSMVGDLFCYASRRDETEEAVQFRLEATTTTAAVKEILERAEKDPDYMAGRVCRIIKLMDEFTIVETRTMGRG